VSAIANTTVISNFASIGQLSLLRQLYGMLYIPTEVEEIQVGLEEGYRFYEGIDQQVHPFIEEGWLRQHVQQRVLLAIIPIQPQLPGDALHRRQHHSYVLPQVHA